MSDLSDQLKNIEAEALKGCPELRSLEDVKLYRARFLGKNGLVTALLKTLSTLTPEERPVAGKKINDLKEVALKKIEEMEESLKKSQLSSSLGQRIDVTLTGRSFYDVGKLHPVMQVLDSVEEIFTGLNFSISEGPEIETDYFNFEALNIPKDHPARDMQDTFYVKDVIPAVLSGDPVNAGDSRSLPDTCRDKFRGNDKQELLLRTHTSPVQIHVMKKFKPPIRMIFPGAVYRKDTDITHSPMFHQVEGLMIDEWGKVRMSDLKGVLTEFVHRLFGSEIKVRFRPSFFSFTEPSAELDIQCVICGGKKEAGGEPCRVCKRSGWLEVLGCGMVDPNVFKAVGYDPKKVSGFAFGMGVERLAMLKYGISDIRLFFENDLRFLRQF